MTEHVVLISESEKERCENLPYSLPSKLRDILDGFKWAVKKKNTSAVLIIDGKSGKGKTTLAGQCAGYCDESYLDKENNLKKIHWLPETFLNGKREPDGSYSKIGLAQAQPGDVIIFDEGMIVSSRSSLSEINRMIVIAMSMIRSKRIIIIFNINSIFDFDRNLALSRADLLLHCYGESLTDRGRFLAFFQGGDGRDRIKELFLIGRKYYDYSKPDSNFYSVFSSYFVFDEETYEHEKQLGVNDFLAKGSKKLDKAAISRDKYVIWLRENTKLTIEEIAVIGSITSRTIDNIIARNKYGN